MTVYLDATETITDLLIRYVDWPQTYVLPIYWFGTLTTNLCYYYPKFWYEPQHEKTNNVDSDQVWHKPGCTVTGDG